MKKMICAVALGGLATVLAGAPRGVVDVDGSLDGGYGDPAAVQNTQTSFGDNTDSDQALSNGSELAVGDVLIANGNLYIFLGGNLESNFNKLEIFIDAREGGQNRLRGDNPDVDWGGLNRLGDDGSGNGLTFDEGFEADMWIGLTCGVDGEFAFHANYAEIRTDGGGLGNYLGSGTAGADGVLVSAKGMQVALDNSNVDGVGGGEGIDCGEGVATGVEIAIPLYLFDWDGEGISIDSAQVCAMVNNLGHDYLSNQVLGGIGGGTNLGDPRAVDLNGIEGVQHFSTEWMAEPCPEPTGACCLDGGLTCENYTSEDCELYGGAFQGLGTACSDGACDAACESDVTGDGVVDVEDLLQIIGDWGCGN